MIEHEVHMIELGIRVIQIIELGVHIFEHEV